MNMRIYTTIRVYILREIFCGSVIVLFERCMSPALKVRNAKWKRPGKDLYRQERDIIQ